MANAGHGTDSAHPVARQRTWPVWTALVIGLAASLTLYAWGRRQERARLEAGVEAAALRAAQDLGGVVERHLESLESIRSLYAASVSVERDEFQQFTREPLGRHAGVAAFVWAPRIALDQRETFEQAARAEGLAGFQIVESTAEGVEVPAGPRRNTIPSTTVRRSASARCRWGSTWPPRRSARTC